MTCTLVGMKMTHATDRPTERSALIAWYEAALADQEASGLSVAAYAVKIGVTPATLYQWRRRLTPDRGSDEAAAGLVRVRVARNVAQGVEEHAARLIVRLSRGRSIEIPAGFEAEELARVIEVLEAC